MMADWIDETLIDPETHLVFDGIKEGSLDRAQFTYCQGVVLGLETELAVRTRDDRHRPRVHRLVAAVAEYMANDGVLKSEGGGDGGLFGGVTIRYLALVASALPGDTAEDVAARDTARRLVMTSAQSAWDFRQSVDGLPLFGAHWDRTAEVPTAESGSARFAGGAVYRVGDARARPVRAAVGMDADGGGAHADRRMTVRADDPLTGRDDELAFIRRALGAGGKYAGVVVVGAAGVGKTRLGTRSDVPRGGVPASAPTGSSAPSRHGHFRWAPSRTCSPTRWPNRCRTCVASSIPLSHNGNGVGR